MVASSTVVAPAGIKSENATTSGVPEIEKSTASAPIRCNIKYKLVSKRKVAFTKELAQKFIDMETFEGERPLRDDHVDHLVAKAKCGEFLFELAQLVSCECGWDGVERRLNGQHTSWMRAFMPENWTPDIEVVKYSAETWDDFRKLYSQIDRGAPRTRSHVLVCRLLGTETYTNKRLIGWLGKGLTVYLAKSAKGGGHVSKKYPVEELATMMESTHFQLCSNVAKVMETFTKTDGHMLRGSVYGAIFTTMAKCQADSFLFWETVRSGLGITSASDPRHKLRDFLQTSTNDPNGAKPVSSQDMYAICLSMWNAFRDKREVKILKKPTHMVAH